ncbi:50S ribosomal protein L29 [Lactobacillus agilis]|uniref:50S ribosomal protein L29 n=1 Tax=Ligilactobacillus agilis TaxID=1601 RepID=UPI0014319AD6|nr:50S ribosomal protein L29 [Ligilactobacillus agilis]NJE33076.1 50S ribosomal protein L29 [Ligilactobacillus agilis]
MKANEILEKKDKQVRDEIKTLSSTELVELEKQFKEELFNLRFQLATGQLENTARLNKVRKNIARIKTALRQAELNK